MYLDAYGALYAISSGKRLSYPLLIPAKSSQSLLQSNECASTEQEIVLALHHTPLKTELSQEELAQLPSTTLNVWETDFRCTLHSGTLVICKQSEWESIYQYTANKVDSLDAVCMDHLRNRLSDNPYCSLQATVRHGPDLPAPEISFLDARAQHVHHALEKVLAKDIKAKKTVRIGIAGSGGGFRAMLNMLGSLLAAEQTGLLDCVTYISGVSGSTWALAPLVTSGKSVEKLKEECVTELAKDFFTIPLNISQCTRTLLSKKMFDEPLSLVDMFGLLLARHLLTHANNDPDLVYLHDQIERIADGKMFCPIYSPIIDGSAYQWVEFTPFEAGSTFLQSSIPSWSCGRPFVNGMSVNFDPSPSLSYPPPLSLGYLMGMWGSAFAAIIAPNLAQLAQNIPYISEFAKIEPTGLLSDIIPAQIHNWNYQLENKKLNDQKYLTLVDGGIFINFDFNSLLRRKCDIIIILDASSDLATSYDLKKAAAYFGKRYKLPPINFDGITQRTATVFSDTQCPDVPTIIYMPQIKNPHNGFDPASCLSTYCSTFSLSYTAQESQNLIETARLNMLDALPIIKGCIEDRLAVK